MLINSSRSHLTLPPKNSKTSNKTDPDTCIYCDYLEYRLGCIHIIYVEEDEEEIDATEEEEQNYSKRDFRVVAGMMVYSLYMYIMIYMCLRTRLYIYIYFIE